MKVYAASIPVYKDVMPLDDLLEDCEIHQGKPLVAVDQGTVGKFTLSYNPDDKRFYVHNKKDDVVATFAERRNAVYYARTH